jgi:hypothetical protein
MLHKQSTSSYAYKTTGFESVMVTGLPLNVVHIVKGSDPDCLVMCTPVVVALAGNCTGIGTEHVLLRAVTVALTMESPSAAQL